MPIDVLIELIEQYAPQDREFYDLHKRVATAKEAGATEKQIVSELVEILHSGLNENDWRLLQF